jgi:hypothetical protein
MKGENMKLEISLHLVLIVFAAMVWLSTIYMRVVVGRLKKQLVEAQNIEYLGKYRCESADKNYRIIDKFYKIVIAGMFILIIVFIMDEAVKLFHFFKNNTTPDNTIFQLLSKLININIILGILAGGGFWLMVRDVRDYSNALVIKCKELGQ